MILSRFFVMLVLLFCELSEQYSQTKFPIIKPFKVTKKGENRMADIYNNNNLLHLYRAFLGTQSTLHRSGGSPQPPPVCSIHLMMRRQPYCSRTPPTHQLQVERRQWWRCMGMIRRPWWSEANLGQSGQRYKMLYLSYKKIRTKIQITNTHNIQVKQTVLYFQVQ